MVPQMPGSSSNSQSALMQSTLAQQQWLVQIQPTAPVTVSPYPLQHQQQRRQQQALLSQQIYLNSLCLSHQQICQLFLHQSQMVTPQKHLHQKSEQFQQQQPSPRIEGAAAEQSPHLTGSHPGTNACGARTVGRSSERGIGSQLLGQRKLQDLVSRIYFDKFRSTWSRHSGSLLDEETPIHAKE